MLDASVSPCRRYGICGTIKKALGCDLDWNHRWFRFHVFHIDVISTARLAENRTFDRSSSCHLCLLYMVGMIICSCIFVVVRSHVAPGCFPVRGAPRQVEVCFFFNHVADLYPSDKFLLLEILKNCAYVYICDLCLQILLHIGFTHFQEHITNVAPIGNQRRAPGETRGCLEEKTWPFHVYVAAKASTQQ